MSEEKNFKERYQKFRRKTRKIGRNITVGSLITFYGALGGGIGYGGYKVYDAYKSLEEYMTKENLKKELSNAWDNTRRKLKSVVGIYEPPRQEEPKPKTRSPFLPTAGGAGLGILYGFLKGRKKTKYSRMKDEHEDLKNEVENLKKENEDLKTISWETAQILNKFYQQGLKSGADKDPEYLKIKEKIEKALRATENNSRKSLEGRIETPLLTIGIIGLIISFAASTLNLTGFLVYNLSKTKTFYFSGLLFIISLLLIFLGEELIRKN